MKSESRGPQGLPAVGPGLRPPLTRGLETGLTLSRHKESKPLCRAHIFRAFGGSGRSWEVARTGYNWPSPGPILPLKKGPLKEGSVSQPGEGMCLIKVHKNGAGKARELFHLSQSILVCVLPGKSGLCRKNFPNGFHMPASPRAGPSAGAGAGAGAPAPSSPTLSLRAHPSPAAAV